MKTLCRRFYRLLFADKAIDFQGKETISVKSHRKLGSRAGLRDSEPCSSARCPPSEGGCGDRAHRSPRLPRDSPASRAFLPEGIKTVPKRLLQAMGSPHPNLAEADEGFSANLTERTHLGFGRTVRTLKAHASHGDARCTQRSCETGESEATVRVGDSIVRAAVPQAQGRRRTGKGLPFWSPCL